MKRVVDSWKRCDDSVKRRVASCLLAVGSLYLAACSSTPPPVEVQEASAWSKSKSAEVSRLRAPQLHAEAEAARQEAEALAQQGKPELAALKGQYAIALYQQAEAATRAEAALERKEAASAELEQKKAKLAALEQENSRLKSEAERLELEAWVKLDQLPKVDVTKPTAERLAARQAATKQISSEAANLCLAAELLGRSDDSLKKTEAAISNLEVERGLDDKLQKPELYNRALTLRSQCLGELTQARRERSRAEPQRARADELLSKLSSSGQYLTYRDDRGVVVQLRGLKLEAHLSAELLQALEGLGKVAAEEKDFPVLVLLHTASFRVADQAKRLVDQINESLKKAGATRVSVRVASDAEPLVNRRSPEAEQFNQRLELIFVSPSY